MRKNQNEYIMKILGIESSCDETSAAVVEDSANAAARICSNVVLSQLEEHRAFGGVVPEIAARAHLDHMDNLIRAAMDDAGLPAGPDGFAQLDGIAATCGPGLIGGVLVGMMAGKTIAAAHNLPFIAVNHLEGHALTPRLTDDTPFPYLLLLISGGHSQILVAKAPGEYELWGSTLDDAAGECFDKSAKIMGLPYPGGPELQKIALECMDKQAALARFDLPRPMKGRKELDFSFSGLKTAIRNHVEKLPAGDLKREDIADLAYAFEDAMCDVLRDRCKRALTRFKQEFPGAQCHFVVSGGVAANTAIRAALIALCDDYGFHFYAPPLKLCGDNAAMIAWAGMERLKAGLTDPLDFKAKPRWPLQELSKRAV